MLSLQWIPYISKTVINTCSIVVLLVIEHITFKCANKQEDIHAWSWNGLSLIVLINSLIHNVSN